MCVSSDQIERLKKLKKEKPQEFNIEFEKIMKDIFKKNCSKIKYKSVCNPSYCAFAYTGCEYIKKIRELEEKLDIKIDVL